MNNIWFVLGCCFILLEIGNPGLLYFLALSAGAFVTFGASVVDCSLYIQYLLFFLTSAIAIASVYLFVNKTNNSSKEYHSNLEQLIGLTVTVRSIQSDKIGTTKIGSEVWLIKLQGDKALHAGAEVKILGIQGSHLQVKLVNG